MKRKKTYFAILFLVGFLTSFGLNTYIGQLSSGKKQTASVLKDTELSSLVSSGASQDDLVFEENINNLEKDGLDMDLIHVPFLFSFLSVEVNQLQHTSVEPLTEYVHNPIYIAVHSFRI